MCVCMCDDIGPKLTLFLFSFLFHRVRNWALKFGVDLWEFGRQFTKMNDIKTVSKSYLFVLLSHLGYVRQGKSKLLSSRGGNTHAKKVVINFGILAIMN